jgi:hypothetical protein
MSHVVNAKVEKVAAEKKMPQLTIDQSASAMTWSLAPGDWVIFT